MSEGSCLCVTARAPRTPGSSAAGSGPATASRESTYEGRQVIREATTLLIAACTALALVDCADGGDPRERTKGVFPPIDDLELHFVRTDFSDDGRWRAVLAEAMSLYGMFSADILSVDDRRFDALTAERLLKLVPPDQEPFHVFLVDRETLTRTDHPVLVVNLFEPRGRSFRVVPPELWSVQANLALANMDWEDFTVALDADGVFRGFRQ